MKYKYQNTVIEMIPSQVGRGLKYVFLGQIMF